MVMKILFTKELWRLVKSLHFYARALCRLRSICDSMIMYQRPRGTPVQTAPKVRTDRPSIRQPKYQLFPYSTESQILYMFRKVRREIRYLLCDIPSHSHK